MADEGGTSRLDELYALIATKPLAGFTVEYGNEAVTHDDEGKEIALTFDDRGGARWRTYTRYEAGIFSMKIQTPQGDTSGLDLTFYISSQDGDDARDEVDFQFLGNDKCIVQTNYFWEGIGGHEETHELGFDSSEDFHEYTIYWSPVDAKIEWLVDGVPFRTVEKADDEGFPVKPMFLYASVWDASEIDEGNWCGKYIGSDAPYIMKYRDVLVPQNPEVQLTELLTITTNPLPEIAVDYGHELIEHDKEENEIALTFDDRGGARWRSDDRFESGTFSMKIKAPDGDTSGLNLSFYLSSQEGDDSQDEIDFEFLGNDKGIMQTNYFTAGVGGREEIHKLGFDSSLDFHDYTIQWTTNQILWLIDGVVVRTAEKRGDEPFPAMPMYVYSSFWDASDVGGGKWCGTYTGSHAPYIGKYRDVRVPKPAPPE